MRQRLVDLFDVVFIAIYTLWRIAGLVVAALMICTALVLAVTDSRFTTQYIYAGVFIGAATYLWWRDD